MFGCVITHYNSFLLAAQCIEGFKSDGIVNVTCATSQIKAVVVKNGAKKCYIFSTFLQLHLE